MLFLILAVLALTVVPFATVLLAFSLWVAGAAVGAAARQRPDRGRV